MLSTLVETKQMLSVYVKELSMAIQRIFLRPKNIQVGSAGKHRTAQETQDYLKNSQQGQRLGVSHLSLATLAHQPVSPLHHAGGYFFCAHRSAHSVPAFSSILAALPLFPLHRWGGVRCEVVRFRR